MMTQLDRLEALAEERRVTQSTDQMELLEWKLAQAVPDLIRVARAAKDANDASYNDFPENWRKANYELKLALAPLYREVEG